MCEAWMRTKHAKDKTPNNLLARKIWFTMIVILSSMKNDIIVKWCGNSIILQLPKLEKHIKSITCLMKLLKLNLALSLSTIKPSSTKMVVVVSASFCEHKDLQCWGHNSNLTRNSLKHLFHLLKAWWSSLKFFNNPQTFVSVLSWMKSMGWWAHQRFHEEKPLWCQIRVDQCTFGTTKRMVHIVSYFNISANFFLIIIAFDMP